MFEFIFESRYTPNNFRFLNFQELMLFDRDLISVHSERAEFYIYGYNLKNLIKYEVAG